MAVHGRPYWGARIEAGLVDPLPIDIYELDGELKFVDWALIHTDAAPGYISPQLTFVGEPHSVAGGLIGPPPGHIPSVPLRVYYSYTGNGVDWQLVDPADYIHGPAVLLFLNSVLWPPLFAIPTSIFDFVDVDKYFPGGSPSPGEIVYIMWTEHDPVFNARKGLSPKVIGVTPV